MFTFVDNEQLKKELKKIIIDSGISQKEVAERLGMSPQTYQHLINKKQLSFVDVNKIITAIDLDMKIDFVPKEKK